MMSDPTSRSVVARDKGFTLLEMLISIALLSFLLAAVYSTFSLSYRAIKGLDESLIRLQESRMTLDVMARELESLLWKANSKHHTFKLEDRDIYGKQTSRLTFTAFTPVTSGISRLSYFVEKQDGILILCKELEDPYRQESERSKVEILEDVTSFTVETFYNNTWLKTWDAGEMESTPTEIRITITASAKDRPLTLRETIRPKIGKTI